MQNMLEILEKRSISVRSWDSKTYLVSKRRICSVPIEVFIFQLLYFKGLTETKINNLGLFPEGFTTTQFNKKHARRLTNFKTERVGESGNSLGVPIDTDVPNFI